MSEKKDQSDNQGNGYRSDTASDLAESLQSGTPLIKPNRASFGSRVRSNFFAGVVIAAPIGITAWLIWLLFTGPLNNVDKFVKNWLPDSGSNVDAFLRGMPYIGVAVAILGLIFLGALTRNFIGSSIIKVWENLVDSVPIVRNLYRFFKNVFETALQNSDRSFKEVALVEYPLEGLWAISFVVGDARGEMQTQLDDQGEDLVSIFVPTVPNPTSGFLLYVSRKKLRVLSMSVEEAAKVVFSMGLVVPESQDPEAAVAKLEGLARQAQGTDDIIPEKKKRKNWFGVNKKAS